MNTVRKQGWAPEDIDMTIRNGRLVIPVLAAHKKEILKDLFTMNRLQGRLFLLSCRCFRNDK